MSDCKLNIHEEYPLNSVQYDKATGKLAVKLSNPPVTCPEGFYTNKGATYTVDPNISVSKWTFTNHPVILVPSKSMVQVVDTTPPSSFGFGSFLVVALIAGGAYYAWKKGFFGKTAVPVDNSVSTPDPESAYAPSTNAVRSTYEAHAAEPVAAVVPPVSNYRRGGSAPSYNPNPVHSSTSVVQPSHTVVQQAPIVQPVIVGGGGPGFFTGMMMGEMMANGGGYHHDTTTIIERDHTSGSDSGRNYDAPSRNDEYSRSEPQSSYSPSDETPRYSQSDSSNDYSPSDSSNDYSPSDSGSDYSDSSGGDDFSSND